MSKRINMRVLKSFGTILKAVSLFLALLMISTVFAACSPSGGNDEQAPPQDNSAAENNTPVDKELILATTTSVRDSGLMDNLQPKFEEETGMTLKIIAQGTGQAIKTGENGDADLLLVHAKSAEEKFVSEGYGLKRVEFMYNYFVVVGPKDDPAGVKTMSDKNAAQSFKQIMDKKATFISRGDDSGTNKKEISLWKSVNLEPSGNWYVSAGKGMGDVLEMASEMQGYTLTDLATYLSMKDKLDLDIVLDSSEDLLNQYTMIAVNPEKHEGINAEGAQKFIEWMTTDKTLDLINNYGKEEFGGTLFTSNYKGD